MNRMLPVANFAACTALSTVTKPDVVFYGHVTRTPLDAAYAPAGVTFLLSGNDETLAAHHMTVGTGEWQGVLPHPHPLRDAEIGRLRPAAFTPHTP